MHKENESRFTNVSLKGLGLKMADNIEGESKWKNLEHCSFLTTEHGFRLTINSHEQKTAQMSIFFSVGIK